MEPYLVLYILRIYRHPIDIFAVRVMTVAANSIMSSRTCSLSNTVIAFPSSDVVINEFVSVTTIIETTNTPNIQTTKMMSLIL